MQNSWPMHCTPTLTHHMCVLHAAVCTHLGCVVPWNPVRPLSLPRCPAAVIVAKRGPQG